MNGAPVLEGKEANNVHDFVNVKSTDYGAKGDTVWNTVSHVITSGTNDTTAINAAIAAANYTKKTLYFPKGRYLVTPGGLDLIRTNVYGPEAIIQASNSVEDILFPIGNYTEENAFFQKVNLRALLGNGADLSYMYQGTPHGAGLGMGEERCYGSWVQIGYIGGFSYGVYLDGNTLDTHIGSNRFKFGFMAGNTYGIFFHCGDMQLEGNKFDIDYMYANTVHVAMVTTNNTPGWPEGAEGAPFICSNNFDITVMECYLSSPLINSTGFYLNGSNIFANHFEVFGSLLPAQDGTFIVNAQGATRNRFFLNECPPAQIYSTAANVFDMRHAAIGNPLANIITPSHITARSSFCGTAAPTGTLVYYNRGDIVWNTTPSSGGTALWMCTAAGAPGTWRALTLN